jgi:multidrug resistance efflux pump
VGAAWFDQSLLERREGVIAGEGFHVVRARADASAVELADRDDVRAGDVMATFRGPVITGQLRARESEIVSLDANLRSVAPGVVQIDPALTQARADARADRTSRRAACAASRRSNPR